MGRPDDGGRTNQRAGVLDVPLDGAHTLHPHSKDREETSGETSGEAHLVRVFGVETLAGGLRGGVQTLERLVLPVNAGG